jgi:anti-anti-sigma regulatory factor
MGETMASNFKIYCLKNNGNLHLQLLGDFDGTSAYELIHTLERYHGNGGKVFINTCALSSVHPFGLEVFQKNCSIKKLSQSLTFIGEYGTTIAPQGSSAF